MAVEDQGIGILDYFSALDDPRQRPKVLYPLAEILLLVLCGTMAGADDFTEITRWGQLHLDFLRRFLPFARGIPSHDTVNDVVNALDAEAFRNGFVAWVDGLRAADQTGEVIAIDGKTSCGSAAGGAPPLHLVSAWASRQRLVLGQEALAGRDNEIVAIERLLGWLEIMGALITIDAIGCQKKIAKAIIDKGADYLLALKSNQPALHEDVTLWFEDGLANGFAGATVRFHETVDADHGPQNMALVRQASLNLIKAAKGKMSFKTARKAAGWSNDFLHHAITGKEMPLK